MLSANEQLSSSDEDNNNKEGTIAETKEVVPVEKKLVISMKKHDTSCNEETQNIVAEAKRKANDSVAGGETIQPELLDFLMD